MTDANWSGFVQKKAFKVLTKANWKRRWLKFDAEAFSLAWSDNEKTENKPKHVFQLNASEIEYKPCEDHKKPFEVKVSSNGNTLFFCLESADQLNNLMARVDAARRTKVASVESNGTVFKSSADVEKDGSGVYPHEHGPKVLSWGVGILLGIGKDGINGMSVPQRIPQFRDRPAVTAISAGPEHAGALTDDAQVQMWGSNEFYQLSQPQDVSACPKPVSLGAFFTKKVLSIACGGSHSLGIVSEGGSTTAGTLFAWGTGTVGQLGLGNSAQILDSPQQVPMPAGKDGKPMLVTNAYAGLVSSAALTSTGECYVWGDASAGRLGLPNIREPPTMGDEVPTFVNGMLVWAPQPLTFDPAQLRLGNVSTCRPVHVALGGAFSLFLLWTGGPGCVLVGSGALGVDITRDSYGYPPRDDRDVQAMIDDEVRAVTRRLTPDLIMPFGTRPMVLDVFAGARHAAAVVLDDRAGAPRLYTAGKGWLGHGNDGDSVLLTRPTVSQMFQQVVSGLENEDIVQAGCGHSHTVARTADGRVWAWGRGDSGELGQGNLSDRSTPKECKKIDQHSWTNVAAGSYYTIGVVQPSREVPVSSGFQAADDFKKRWGSVVSAQEAAIAAVEEAVKPKAAPAPAPVEEAPAPAPAAASKAAPAAPGGKKGGAKDDGKAAKEKKAQTKAKDMLDANELPPGWGWDQTEGDDAEIYYIQPDGETTWDDPRPGEDSGPEWEKYWRAWFEDWEANGWPTD